MAERKRLSERRKRKIDPTRAGRQSLAESKTEKALLIDDLLKVSAGPEVDTGEVLPEDITEVPLTPQERHARLKARAQAGGQEVQDFMKKFIRLGDPEELRRAGVFKQDKVTPQETAGIDLNEIDEIPFDFGTGEMLRRNLVGLDLDNPIGQAFEEDILDPSEEGPDSFLRNLVASLSDDGSVDAIEKNRSMLALMQEGDPSLSTAVKKSKVAGSKTGVPKVRTPSSDIGFDKDTAELLTAMRSKDLSADALQADIVAGIGERFRGERPSMTMSKSGAFGGSTPQVARALLAEKLRARRDAEKLASQQVMANQRAMLENRRLKAVEFSNLARALNDTERRKLKTSKNKISAVKSMISGIVAKNKQNIIWDETGRVPLMVDPKKQDAHTENMSRIELLNKLIGSFADITPELDVVEDVMSSTEE